MKYETADAIDATMAALGTKATYTGAGVTGLGWFLSSEFFGLVGMLIGVVGLCITWYYKQRADVRHAKEHEIRVQKMLAGQQVEDLRDQGADE